MGVPRRGPSPRPGGRPGGARRRGARGRGRATTCRSRSTPAASSPCWRPASGPRARRRPMPDASGFLEAIYARYGYDLREYALPSMTRRLQVALAKTGAPDLGALQDRVLADPVAFASVLGDLT